MFWYLVICVLMFYPCMILYLGKRQKINTQILALQVSCSVLCFFMAMRSQKVGVDTKYYCHVFQQLKNTPFLRVPSVITYATTERTWTFDFEIGYRFYNKLVGYLSGSPQTIIIFNSCVIFFLLYQLIKKTSKNYFLSIWLYITLGVFQTEMNVARNAIAIMICYYALHYIEDKKWKQYMLLICIAGTIHKSVLIFIPLYFWLKRPFCKTSTMRHLIEASVIAGIGLLFVGPRIQNFFSTGVGKYLTESNEKTESLFVGIFYLFLVFFVWIMMKPKERKNVFQNCPIGSWMFLFALCCFGANIGFKMAARVAALFGTYMIIFIPDLLDKIKNEDRRIWISFLVAAGCGLQYILRLMINNIGGTLPYSFFW